MSNSEGGDGTLRVAYNAGLSTIDPAFACDTVGYTVIRSVYDQLLQTSTERTADGAEKVEPMLAESWEASDDNREYTFELRDDVKFASGNPLTADDVVFSINRALEKEACAEYVITAGLHGNISKVQKAGNGTVKITLKKADPLFLTAISSRAASILDSKEVEANGGLGKEGDEWLATHAAGSGPYTITTYQPDSEVDLVANESYWQGQPANAEVSLRIVTDPLNLETLARSGEVDMAYGVPLKSIGEMESAGSEIAANPSQFNTYLGLNTKQAPLDDPKVRQAIAAAVPAQALVDQFGFGLAESFSGPIPPAMPLYPDLPVPEQELEKASELVEEAGGGNVSLSVDVQSGESAHQEIATVLQDALRGVGIDLEVNTLGAAAFTDRVYNFKSQAYIIDDGPTINDPGYFLGYLVRCDDAFNWAQYCNKEVDKNLEEARFEFDEERRGDLYRSISEQVVEDAPYVSIMAQDHVVVLQPGVEGYAYYDDQVPRLWRISP